MAKSIIPETPISTVNLIAAGATIKGEITTDGDIRIDGTIIGTVNSKGKLIIGKTGRIEGEVNCRNADFSGEIKAKVNVSELLSLKSTCKLIGDIVANKLAVEPGAVFSGSCSMTPDKTNNLSANAFDPTKISEKK